MQVMSGTHIKVGHVFVHMYVWVMYEVQGKVWVLFGYTGTCRSCIVHRHMYFMLIAQINVGHVWYTVPCSSCLGGKSFLFVFFISKKHPSRNTVLPAKQVKYISSCVTLKSL